MFDELSWSELAPALAASFSAGFHGQNGTAQGIAVAQQILEQKRKAREDQAARGMLAGLGVEVPEGVDPKTALSMFEIQRNEQRYQEGLTREAEERAAAVRNKAEDRRLALEDERRKRDLELGDARMEGKTLAKVGNLFDPRWEMPGPNAVAAGDGPPQGLTGDALAELRGPGMFQGIVDAGEADWAYYPKAVAAARQEANLLRDDQRAAATAEEAERRRIAAEQAAVRRWQLERRMARVSERKQDLRDRRATERENRRDAETERNNRENERIRALEAENRAAGRRGKPGKTLEDDIAHLGKLKVPMPGRDVVPMPEDEKKVRAEIMRMDISDERKTEVLRWYIRQGWFSEEAAK
jgi:hypothetical protein